MIGYRNLFNNYHFVAIIIKINKDNALMSRESKLGVSPFEWTDINF